MAHTSRVIPRDGPLYHVVGSIVGSIVGSKVSAHEIRPRTRVTRDEVLALRSQGPSYRAAARHPHISPALAHQLAQDSGAADLPGRSETPPARLETAPNPHASPEAFQRHHTSATAKRRDT